ncbi:MAG: hypothetical protein H8D97_01870 [Proteobacteria bacterium]|nr:hypothetical protein [Pseudomonadota bacterium]
MACKVCNGDQKSKPIKFFWKEDIFYMEDIEFEDLKVREQLGLDVPEGITNFEICMNCNELITANPEDLPKYEQLIEQMLKDIILTNAEQTIIESEIALGEELIK